MESERQVTKKPDGRKTRKRSPRSLGLNGPASAASIALKKKWADPEFRARMLPHLKRGSEAARKVGFRLGVPDGMRKSEALAERNVATESAKKTMAELEKVGAIKEDEDPRAKEALEAALIAMRMPQDQKIRIAAARLVLDFTKSKPASKSIVSVNEAEEWLRQVAKENDDEGKAAEDA